VATPLEPIADSCRAVLDARYAAREAGLADSRRVIRASANAIRHLHRGEGEEARRLIDEAGDLLRRAEGALGEHPSILHAGFVADAAKEYAEASLTAAAFAGVALPLPEALGVDPVPFLHGLGEAVGECRRRLLDLLREGEVEKAEPLLTMMDGVVDLLASLDYPDGMTSGLRRTADLARSLAERSRADLTATAVQERLRRELAERFDG
jgi:translin